MTGPTWESDVPPEIRAAVEPLLQRWWVMVPGWCEEFTVKYSAKRDARMAVSVNYRNRWALLIVTGQWLQDAPEERENSLRHELVHILVEPLTAGVRRIIEDTLEAGTPTMELCDSIFTDGMEAAVEDLARAFGRVAP